MNELLGTRVQPERWSRSGSLCAEVGTGRAVLPHAPFLAPALFLRCASDSFSLTKPDTSCKIEWPASLRSEGVRVHPGMPFGFPSETAFGFAGIPRRPVRGLQGQGDGPEARFSGLILEGAPNQFSISALACWQ
jgi:hypothetical protein